MAYEEYVKTIEVESIEELFDLIKGKSNFPDLRENFIFRGLGDIDYDLIPSSLRKKKGTNEYVISDFVDDSLIFTYPIHLDKLLEMGEITQDFYDKYDGKGFILRNLDKNLDEIEYDGLYKQVDSKEEVAFIREVHVLLKFLDYSDKAGLKIPFNQRIRNLIHKDFDSDFKRVFHYWPHEDYFELISLAQHYNLPTRALDWSYDYNVALYFATKDVLSKEDTNDCVLWALNYNCFKQNFIKINDFLPPFPLYFYRPEYNINPNLNAQKGLFTFWSEPLIESSNESLDILLTNKLDAEKEEKYSFSYDKIFLNLEENEKVFYKFIIPKELKAGILKELYLEGYSEEFLFPGYEGVSLAIKNKVKLDQLLQK